MIVLHKVDDVVHDRLFYGMKSLNKLFHKCELDDSQLWNDLLLPDCILESGVLNCIIRYSS